MSHSNPQCGPCRYWYQSSIPLPKAIAFASVLADIDRGGVIVWPVVGMVVATLGNEVIRIDVREQWTISYDFAPVSMSMNKFETLLWGLTIEVALLLGCHLSQCRCDLISQPRKFQVHHKLTYTQLFEFDRSCVHLAPCASGCVPTWSSGQILALPSGGWAGIRWVGHLRGQCDNIPEICCFTKHFGPLMIPTTLINPV